MAIISEDEIKKAAFANNLGAVSRKMFESGAKWANRTILNKAVGEGYLQDWYQNSIDETVPPVWTDAHIEELLADFYVIPRRWQ